MGVKEYAVTEDSAAREHLDAGKHELFGPLCVCPECSALTGRVQYVLVRSVCNSSLSTLVM